MAKSTPERGSIGQAFLYNDRFYIAYLMSSGKSLYQSRQSKLGSGPINFGSGEL